MSPTDTPSLPRRLASMLYEALLLIGVISVLVLLPQTLYAQHTGKTAAPWLAWLHLECVLAAYFVWFWSQGRQTLAMKTWKIHLVCARNQTAATGISPQRALLRHGLSWLSILPAGLGLLWALVDREGQFLHDRLAGTRLKLITDARTTIASPPPPAKKSRRA
ncbi:MAG: RDD family protein [Sterolibacterium sp.]|nr:RDD family protein [Sterolibacterium sp.]